MAFVGGGEDYGGFRPAFPLVGAYFDENYVDAGVRVFDQRFPVRLLVTRATKPVRRFGPLDWPCFR
jgi:hypothetical protein